MEAFAFPAQSLGEIGKRAALRFPPERSDSLQPKELSTASRVGDAVCIEQKDLARRKANSLAGKGYTGVESQREVGGKNDLL